MIRKIIIATVTVGLLAGCSSTGGRKENAGAIIGGLAGGLAGSEIGGGSGRLWATGAGAVLGALIGSEIGRSLDRADRLALERNTQAAFTAPLNEPIVWDNPDNGNRIVVTPTNQGRLQSTGAYCREFQQTITIGGKKEDAFGTACQQPDGSWKIIS